VEFGPEHLPTQLTQAFSSGRVQAPTGETALHSNVSLDEALELYTAVRRIKPLVSVEVGFAQGISTLAILKALEDNGQGVHHVMDPFQARFENVGLTMVANAGLQHRLQFYEKEAEHVIPSLPNLQFGFIDASHLFDLTLLEFVLIDKKLDIGGVVGMHDLWMPSLQRLYRYVIANRAYRKCESTAKAKEPLSSRQKARHILARLLRRIVPLQRVLSVDFLQPWSELDVPNMVLLEKTANDQRDWKHYARF
jgi:predicted O-methyltransferase YrrM